MSSTTAPDVIIPQALLQYASAASLVDLSQDSNHCGVVAVCNFSRIGGLGKSSSLEAWESVSTTRSSSTGARITRRSMSSAQRRCQAAGMRICVTEHCLGIVYVCAVWLGRAEIWVLVG